MIKKIIYPFLYITLLFSFVACKKDFLEVVPLGNQVATTTDDYDKLMNNPVFYMNEASGGQEAVSMGDETGAEAAFLNRGTVWMPRLFQWADSIYKPGDEIPYPFMLREGLENMYLLNKIITEVMASSGGSDTQKKQLLGEAKATRAWLNLLFVNYYAKPYNAATAATDPGFPIIDKADITVQRFDRGSVQSSYDFIIKDLTDALADVPVHPRIVTRMSKPAVAGLLGKVYVFMGRYADALPLLDNAFAAIAANGAPVLYNYNVEFAPGGAFLPIDPTFGPQGPGVNRNDTREAILSKVYYNGPNRGNMFGTDGLVLMPAVAALYGPHDQRLLLYTNRDLDGNLNPGGRLRKYGITWSRYGLQLPELYLLRAECRARTNDLGGAITDLETLRRNRMPAADAQVPPAVAGNQVALIKYIIDERIREFAQEGYRWFDMRRLSVDPIFSGKAITRNLYNTNGTTTVITLRQPDRLVMKIPPYFLQNNPGMPDNP
ncbi:RagB/SusD family nutrient uptake outer membrane protein [Chitinophaga sp. ARDCPP14]|uniref:RagB/SusD family nutrient uptake outer membrane protein n=1 Tax=Chitinophaga sp. ARDCPP14 TaxID=3391139 RepID=UPI003F5237D2